MTEDDVRKLLDEQLDAMTQTALAGRIGVSPAFLNKVMRHHAKVSPKIADYFGLTMVETREFV